MKRIIVLIALSLVIIISITSITSITAISFEQNQYEDENSIIENETLDGNSKALIEQFYNDKSLSTQDKEEMKALFDMPQLFNSSNETKMADSSLKSNIDSYNIVIKYLITIIDSIRKLIMNDETIEYLTDLALETFNKESTVLPILQKQYAQTLTAINNLITAMEKGIITPTTKERMEELEAEKSELSIKIMKEEMSQPKLSREEILYWFYKFRKLNPKKLDHRRSLINNFVNSVFLFEDRMVINFNFKDGTETITFADLEKSALGSDLKVSGAPIPRSFGRGIFLCGTNFSQPGCAETFFVLKVSSREHRTTRVGILTKLPPSLL